MFFLGDLINEFTSVVKSKPTTTKDLYLTLGGPDWCKMTPAGWTHWFAYRVLSISEFLILWRTFAVISLILFCISVSTGAEPYDVCEERKRETLALPITEAGTYIIFRVDHQARHFRSSWCCSQSPNAILWQNFLLPLEKLVHFSLKVFKWLNEAHGHYGKSSAFYKV